MPNSSHCARTLHHFILPTLLALALTACGTSPRPADDDSGGAGGGGSTGGTGGAGGAKPRATCGDGRIDPGEACDGDDFGGHTCATEGPFVAGKLTCSQCQLDTRHCIAAGGCGDGVVSGNEQCDGSDLLGLTCVLMSTGDVQFLVGELRCGADCRLDTSACTRKPVCGNGTIEAGESCEGTNLRGFNCATVPGGYNTGTLSCVDCAFDTSECSVDPCANTNACLLPGAGCDDDTLVSCRPDAFGCLIETRADCAPQGNGDCDESGGEPVCIGDLACTDQCGVLGATCVGDDLITCARGPHGCKVATTVACDQYPGGSCVQGASGPTCELGPHPCAGKDLCAGVIESVRCVAGTQILEECSRDGDGCLVRTRVDCSEQLGGYCDATPAPHCEWDPCLGKPLCAGDTESLTCLGGMRLERCAWDSDGCLARSSEDCTVEPLGYCAIDTLECRVAACGNGLVEGAEQCDPPDGLGCNEECRTQAYCGDGEVTEGESCEPPNTLGCNAACEVVPYCGDGKVDPGEACDPPNDVTCDAACAIVITNNPFFIEYVEGAGTDKALTIVNGGMSYLALGTCDVTLYRNGDPSPNVTLTLITRQLAPGATHTLCSTSGATKWACDQAAPQLDFNGNDALILRCQGQTFDVIGQRGFDPGDAWEANGVSTESMTLWRKCTVITGDTNDPDPFDPSVQWKEGTYGPGTRQCP